MKKTRDDDRQLRIRKALALLNAIAVLQPVNARKLARHFHGASRFVKDLEEFRLVRKLNDKMWILTARGLSFGGTQEMGRQRDILRMFELVDRSRSQRARRGKGAHGLGDVSSPIIQGFA